MASGCRDGSILVWNLKDQITVDQGFGGYTPKDSYPDDNGIIHPPEEGRQCKNGKGSSGVKASKRQRASDEDQSDKGMDSGSSSDPEIEGK